METSRDMIIDMIAYKLWSIEDRGTAGTKGKDGENCIMWSFTCCDLVAGRWPAYCWCTFMCL